LLVQANVTGASPDETLPVPLPIEVQPNIDIAAAAIAVKPTARTVEDDVVVPVTRRCFALRNGCDDPAASRDTTSVIACEDKARITI
jgi:hypothetical protein